MNNLLTLLLTNTYSLHQLKHRLATLKSYLDQQFFGGNIAIAAKDLDWIKTLPTASLNLNKDNLTTIFEEAQNQINNLSILTLYLTFEPDEQTITQIGEFARKTFGGTILLDIKFDPNLIAGAALAWKGSYKDYSLRAKIQERKGEVLESFKKFLR